MSHKHAWKEQYITKRHVDILQFKCVCGEQMMTDEIERRLNATECLSAKDAKSQAIEHDCMDDKFRSDLLNYADILEDKE